MRAAEAIIKAVNTLSRCAAHAGAVDDELDACWSHAVIHDWRARVTRFDAIVVSEDSREMSVSESVDGAVQSRRSERARILSALGGNCKYNT